MSAKARDLLKTRAYRLGEVLRNLALGIGQADSQTIVWGCAISPNSDTTKYDIAAGEVVIGQSLTVLAAAAAQVVPAGASTGAGEFRKVLVQRKADGTVSTVVGDKAASQATALFPDSGQDPASIVVGWLEIPASFTPATTSVTSGMCKAMLYSL